MAEDEILESASEHLDKILDHDDESHNLSHALCVLGHARQALDWATERPSPSERLAILLAALMHDADDYKHFKDHLNHENTRFILAEVFRDLCHESDTLEGYDITPKELIELVVRMIDLVSCSKNHDSVPPDTPLWMLIPRYCDRLESIGAIGVIRCWQYNDHVQMPFFTDATPRPTTREELLAVATPERFLQYRGKSASMMDHYYDTLLHVGNFTTGNKYIDELAARRRDLMIDFCLRFGRSGALPDLKEYFQLRKAELQVVRRPSFLALRNLNSGFPVSEELLQ